MNYTCLIIVGALIGVACGESAAKCVYRISNDCTNDSGGSVMLFTQQTDFCSTNQQLMRCLKYGLSECNQWELAKATDKVIQTYHEACKNGTHLNLEMKKHRACIEHEISLEASFMGDFIEFLHDASKDLIDSKGKTLTQNNKKICMRLDSVKERAHLKVLEKCDQEAFSLMQAVTEPAFQFHGKVCSILDGDHFFSLLALYSLRF